MESFRGTGDEWTDETKETKQEIDKERLRYAVQSVVAASNKQEQTVILRVKYISGLGIALMRLSRRERERGATFVVIKLYWWNLEDVWGRLRCTEGENSDDRNTGFRQNTVVGAWTVRARLTELQDE